MIQLVSEYYNIFSTIEFPTVESCDTIAQLSFAGDNPKCNLKIVTPGTKEITQPDNRSLQVGLCCTFYAEQYMNELVGKSCNKIHRIQLPSIVAHQKPLDFCSRKIFAHNNYDSMFEIYLSQTLLYCTPKIFIEYFRDYYDQIYNSVVRCDLKAIVTECWNTFVPVSIYCAIARQHLGVSLILQQHGASVQWIDCDILWLEKEVADRYMAWRYQ